MVWAVCTLRHPVMFCLDTLHPKNGTSIQAVSSLPQAISDILALTNPKELEKKKIKSWEWLDITVGLQRGSPLLRLHSMIAYGRKLNDDAKFERLTDHHSYQWLCKMKVKSPLLLRWQSQMEELNYHVRHRPGKLQHMLIPCPAFPSQKHMLLSSYLRRWVKKWSSSCIWPAKAKSLRMISLWWMTTSVISMDGCSWDPKPLHLGWRFSTVLPLDTWDYGK